MSDQELQYHTSLAEIARQYQEELLNMNRHAAEHLIFSSIDKGITIKDIYLSVFQPVQWEIGRLWQQNKISVAMEHYCTAATQFIMSRLYDQIFSMERIGMSMVATSVSGELHELGIRMVADFFEMEGWNTYYLGASTTKEGVLKMIVDRDVDLLAISTTIYFNLPQAEELIAYVRREMGSSRLKIAVGGSAFNMGNGLWKEMNADLFARDAQQAISKVNEIFSLK